MSLERIELDWPRMAFKLPSANFSWEIDKMPETQGDFPQPVEPPTTRNLTIIWDEEKRDLNQRLEALELDVKDLQSKLQQLLEAYRTYAARTPVDPGF